MKLDRSDHLQTGICMHMVSFEYHRRRQSLYDRGYLNAWCDGAVTMAKCSLFACAGCLNFCKKKIKKNKKRWRDGNTGLKMTFLIPFFFQNSKRRKTKSLPAIPTAILVSSGLRNTLTVFVSGFMSYLVVLALFQASAWKYMHDWRQSSPFGRQ